MKTLALTLSGALLITVGLVSCDNEETTVNELEDLTTAARGGVYDSFELSLQDQDPPVDGWGYEKDMGDNQPCDPTQDGNCLPAIVIDKTIDKTTLENLKNARVIKDFLLNNKGEVSNIFNPTLVNGVIDDYFSLQIVDVVGSKMVKYRFVRNHDGKFVGTYQFVL